jgi:hypothetical protein
MAQTHKLRPRTKYINVKYHHFRTHVGKTITVHKIDSKNQLADGLTKPLDVTAFCIFRDRIMGYELFFPTISAERESEVKSGFSTGKQFTGHTEAVILHFSKLREAGRVFNHESSTESSESSTLGTNERVIGKAFPCHNSCDDKAPLSSIFLDGLYLLNVYLSTGNGNRSSHTYFRC